MSLKPTTNATINDDATTKQLKLTAVESTNDVSITSHESTKLSTTTFNESNEQ